jgi:putative hemin transport protein
MPAIAADLSERIRAAVARAPAKMTLQLAADLEVPEAEIIRHFPNHRATELDPGRWQALMLDLAALGTVHVIVSNGAATIEVVGQFGGFSEWGEFFNVQSETLDMHIRHEKLGAIFAVAKPSHVTGKNTLSFQFYDRAGNAAFKVFLNFGASEPDGDLLGRFHELRDRYRL